MLIATQTPFWLVVLPAATALLGVIVGQLVPEFFNRRTSARARYDGAIIAMGKVSAARQGVGLDFPPEWVRPPDENAYANTQHELSKLGLARFLDANADAKAALAALYPWSPDLKTYWDRPIVDENDFDAIVAILTERRRSPLKRYAARSAKD